MEKRKAVNIEWDCNGDDPKELGLPDEIELPSDLEDDDEISDYITDFTGYCHFGFDIE